MEPISAAGAPTADAGTLLKHDHERLEGVYARLLAAYREGDWNDVRTHWDVFELALRRHLRLEEARMLPAFRQVDAKEADAIQAEHDQLRAQLDTFGVLVELHAFTMSHADALITQLRAHAAREEKLLYPWSSHTVAPDELAARLDPAAE